MRSSPFPIKELSLSHSNQSTALLALWDLFLTAQQAVCRVASALARGSFRKACCSLSELAGHHLSLARLTGSQSWGWQQASFVYCISSTETKLANVQLHQKILPWETLQKLPITPETSTHPSVAISQTWATLSCLGCASNKAGHQTSP